jgi:hypothetical protein
MSALSIQPTYPIFAETDGQPLEDGYIWIGTANLDPQVNPISVYFDAALTVPAGQPIRTINGYPSNSGTPARLYVNSDYSIRVMNKNGSMVYSAPAATERYSGVVIDGLTIDSSDVEFLQSGSGAVVQSVQSKLRNGVDVCVFDFMTGSEIAAVQAYSFSTDVTAACQAALDAARATNRNLFFPSGGYLVTGLIIPGTVSGGTDDRDSAIRIYGQGFGEPFVQTNTGGTVIKSVTDAPVMRDILGTSESGNGTIEIDHIRFDGTSTVAVLRLDSFYGLSSVHNCVVYQRGTGNGVQITYGATFLIQQVYSMNSDWADYAKGAARTGIGFDMPLVSDSGLQTFYKCTSRGWLTGYQLGAGAGTAYSSMIEQCECSVVRNGIFIYGARKVTLDSNYMEGGDGGTGIYIDGEYATVSNNFIFPGFLNLVDDRTSAGVGTVITGNVFAMGSVVNAVGLATAGSYGKEITGNTFVHAVGVAGQVGIFADTGDSKLLMTGNAFDPVSTWTGAGASKVSYTGTTKPSGLVTQQDSVTDFPALMGGALSLHKNAVALTQANVASNVLTVPDGSYFEVTAASAVTVNQLSTGQNSGRLITFRTTNNNMTFADTAYIFTNGAFTGPGTITFIVEEAGGANYAYEIARTVF